MIVTCPACSSRFKFDDARLSGQGAKITCPTCDHLFVVRPPQVDPVTVKDSWIGDEPAEEAASLVTYPGDSHVELETYDFSTHGVILRVRQGLIDQEFHTHAEVKEALRDGSIDYSDELSEDGINWAPIVDFATLEDRLVALRKRLDAGEHVVQRTTSPLVIGDDEGDEDAPTMIVRASSLNLDFDPEEDGEDEPPPPAAGLFDQPAEDPETEAVDAPPMAAKGAATPATPTLKVAEPENRSMLLKVLLVLVVLAVIALMLYRQGVFAGMQG